MNSLGCITWYEVEPHIIRFCNPFGQLCHLVIGQDRALLVDSMGGHGDLRAVVSQVTELPVTVVATHSHYDHIMGAWFFNEVWMDTREAERIDFAEKGASMVHEGLLARGDVSEDEPWCLRDGARPQVALLEAGAVFDLGGVNVEVVALPGHTVGCLGFLARELGVLFTGDAVTPIMTIFFDESASLDTYRETLARMTEMPFERFYTSHHERAFLKSELADFDTCVEFAETDPGSVWVHSVFTFFTGRIHIYRGTDPNADDFMALIVRDTPEAKERARRIRAERRAAKKLA